MKYAKDRFFMKIALNYLFDEIVFTDINFVAKQYYIQL